jgi:hypothetical protein
MLVLVSVSMSLSFSVPIARDGHKRAESAAGTMEDGVFATLFGQCYHFAHFAVRQRAR